MSSPIRLTVCVLLLAPCLLAQFSGAIQGSVLDTTQASVPDAVVTVTNTATGIVRTAKTSTEGFYRVSNLSPGTYSLRVEKPGFAASRLDGLIVNITETSRADFSLTVGTVGEQVR